MILARKHLTDPPGGDIHVGNLETRKCFKWLRDLLRMARPALTKELYRRGNTCCRDAARSLSVARDAQTLVETFDKLQETYGQRVNFSRMRSLRVKRSQRRERLARDRSNLDERIQDVANTIDGSIFSIDYWPLKNTSSSNLSQGGQRVYRRARKGWKLSRSSGMTGKA